LTFPIFYQVGQYTNVSASQSRRILVSNLASQVIITKNLETEHLAWQINSYWK